MPTFVFLAAACVFVGIMGYAVQRGGTCCVAAVGEVVTQRRTLKLRAILLASAWVAVGLAGARALGWLSEWPGHPAPSWATLAGGVLLGLGAYVNGACVFGAVARLGSGQWSYVCTIPGFYLGCLAIDQWPAADAMRRSLLAMEPAWPTWTVASCLVVLSIWRWLQAAPPHTRATGDAGDRPVVSALAARLWSPTAATTVIGVTFAGALVLVGGHWAYTDVLADWARSGMPWQGAMEGWRVALFAALFGGAWFGGWTAGHWRQGRLESVQLIKCLAGGALMGAGSMLIPGGNDSLLLVGVPLLWPHAWLAVATMLFTIGLAMVLAARRDRAATSAGR